MFAGLSEGIIRQAFQLKLSITGDDSHQIIRNRNLQRMPLCPFLIKSIEDAIAL